MPKFEKSVDNGSEKGIEPAITAPAAEHGMIVVKLAVPPWQEPAISIFRDSLQDWLNKAHRGELKPGDQLTLVVP